MVIQTILYHSIYNVHRGIVSVGERGHMLSMTDSKVVIICKDVVASLSFWNANPRA